MEAQITDQLLVQEIKNNNEKAFESVFKKYFSVLTMYAKKYVMDFDVAKDITQDTFIKFYEKREDIEIHTSLKSFLYTSVRNKCLDHIKLNKIRDQHKDQIKYQASISSEDEDAEHIKRTELQEKIYKILKTLPTKNQKIFMMSRIQGKTNQEIADELGLTKRTVETHISNALKRIREAVLLIMVLIISYFFNFF